MGKDSDIAIVGKFLKEKTKERRVENVSRSPDMIADIMRETGAAAETIQMVPLHIRFTSVNGERFDFWPSTKRWRLVGAKKMNKWTGGGGERRLIERIRVGIAKSAQEKSDETET